MDDDPDTWAGDYAALGERTVVVYIGIELDRAHLGPRLAVRTLEDFQAWVHKDGTTHSGGCGRAGAGHLVQPRFAYLGQELTPEMLP